MKVVGFNGSPKKDGNTAAMIHMVFEPLERAGIETEFVQAGGTAVRGCRACYQCAKNKNGTCVITDDPVNQWIAKMAEADGIIIGSPTYFADVTTEIKALIDRAGFVARKNGHMFKRKVGAGVVAVRRAGSIHALDTINHFFLIGQMIIPGSSYWNLGVGGKPGDVAEDREGVQTMTDLGENMAWLLNHL